MDTIGKYSHIKNEKRELKMKRFLLSLLAFTLFLSGCTGETVSVQPSASTMDPDAIMQSPALGTSEATDTSVPTMDPIAVMQSPALGTCEPGATSTSGSFTMIPVSENYLKNIISDVTTYYTGQDDGLFQAAYRALTETSWTDINEALGKSCDYLPEGTSGMILLDDALQKELFGKSYADFGSVSCTKEVLPDMGLAYIAIWGVSRDNFFLVFDIMDNGAYIPVRGFWLGWRYRSYEFTQHYDTRWLKIDHVYLSGTGICLARCDWYNIDSNQIDLSYLSYVGDCDLPWCPLGWRLFNGKMSEPQVEELPDGCQLMIRMEATSRLERSNSDNAWQGEEYCWEKTEPVVIRLDVDTHKAYAENGLDHWYFNVTSEGGDTDNYCAPFMEELSAVINTGNDTEAFWAKWTLSGGYYDWNWKPFFEENGLVYVEEE